MSSLHKRLRHAKASRAQRDARRAGPLICMARMPTAPTAQRVPKAANVGNTVATVLREPLPSLCVVAAACIAACGRAEVSR